MTAKPLAMRSDYAAAHGYYGLLLRATGKVMWMSCRESFETCWQREIVTPGFQHDSSGTSYLIDGFVFYPPQDFSKFLREIEINNFHLKELTVCQKVVVTNVTNNKIDAVWLVPSPFWREDHCRISFLTLFLRIAQNAKNLTEFWKAIEPTGPHARYGCLKPSFEAFLSGRTRYNGDWGLYNARYWVQKFFDKTDKQIKELLV